MHKVKKYNWGGGIGNLSTNQWASSMGLPSTISTIQSSNNFLNGTLANSNTSTNWMNNIKPPSTLATVTPSIMGKINPSLMTDVSKVRGLFQPGGVKDLGQFLGGGFNNMLGQGGSNIVNGLKGFTGLSSGQLTSVAGDLAGMGLEALGVRKMDSRAANGFDKGLNIAAKAVGMVPGVGWAASAALQGLNLVNNFAGSTSKQQGTSDMGNILGYGQADVNQMANAKFGLSDKIKGWFGGKTGKSKANDTTNLFNSLNLSKSVAGYNQNQNQLEAGNSVSHISNKNLQQMWGGLNTNMLSAKQGVKIPPARLRNIINKVETKKLKQGGKLDSSVNTEVNIIPEGAFHSRKHKLPDDISEQVTKKGIPVVSEEGEGKLKQHAEIERNEIIFHKKATEAMEELLEKYNKAETQKEKDKIAIECGKFITNEILVNTDDKTGLINDIN